MKNNILHKLRANMTSMLEVPAGKAAAESILTQIQKDPSAASLESQVSVIIGDAALTHKILRLVNSPMYSPLVSEGSGGISTLSASLQVLGVTAVSHLVSNASSIEGNEFAEDRELSEASLSAELAREIGGSHDSEAYSVAALANSLGRIVVSRFLPQEAKTIATGTSVNEALGMDYADVGSAVATWWGLPKDLLSVIDGTCDPALLAATKFSSSAARHIINGDQESLSSELKNLNASPEVRKRVTLAANKSMDSWRVHRDRAKAKALYGQVSVQEGLDLLRKELWGTSEVVTEDIVDNLLFSLKIVLRAENCSILYPSEGRVFRARSGGGFPELVLSREGRVTIVTALLSRVADVAVPDLEDLKESLIPDFVPELMPTVRMLVMLPVLSGTHVSSILFVAWKYPNSLSTVEIRALKNFRSACTHYLC